MNDATRGKLRERFTVIEDERRQAWLAVHRDPPKRLYHYTNAAGLHGILSSNRLWATNISYLNDASELAYGSSLVAESLKKHKLAASSRSLILALERAAQTFDAFDDGLLDDPYVASFCERGDLLSQWRGYGATGGGYSMGIDSRSIGMRTPAAPPADFDLRRVLYEREEQVRLVDSLIARSSEVLLDLDRQEGDGTALAAIPSFCQFFRAQVVEYLFCFKNAVFKEEAEWRAVSISDDTARLRFRPSPQSIVPYVELDISASVGPNAGKVPLAQIICGPTAHPVLAKGALELYLRNRNYHFVDVVASAVPLRA